MVKQRDWRWGTLQCGLGLGLLLLSHLALALDPQRSLDHYGHQTWRTDSGLPQNTVHAILQTRDGYVWLGTDGGLVRFDGLEFVTFDADNTAQFKSDTVNDLMEDADGALWISTAAGLLRERAGSFATYTTANGLTADTVWFSYQDSRRRLWAVTSAGPALFDGSGFVAVAGAQWAAPLNRQAMAEDAQGRLWLGGSNGVWAVDMAAGTPVVAKHLLNGVEVDALLLDADGIFGGVLWIGCGDGLSRYTRDTLAPVGLPHRTGVTALLHHGGDLWVGTAAGLVRVAGDGTVAPVGSDSLGQRRVERLFEDRRGALWIASERGLFRFADNQLQSFAPGSELSANRVLCLVEDREGDLWLGTDASGLHLLRDQKFTTYTTADGLSGNGVRSVFESANGELWIGTDSAGLNRRTPTGFLHFTTRDGLSSNVILSLASGPGNDLWVGTPDGLNLLHPQGEAKDGRQAVRVERFTSADGLPDDFIRSLYTDGDGSLWVGTRHGLAHFAGGKFTSFSRLDGLGSDFIGVIFRAQPPVAQRTQLLPSAAGSRVSHPLTREGDLWVGTSGGLSQLHHGVFTNYRLAQTPADNSITAIAQDSGQSAGQTTGQIAGPTALAGTLWLGTSGSGLNRLRGAVTPAFPAETKALPSTIYGILEDAQGDLWLSARTGIYRVSRGERNSGFGTSPEVTAYGTADGMNIRECSGGGHPAAARLADGTLWFATLAGVSVIDPLHTQENSVPPPVVIEKILVDDRPRSAAQAMTMRPGADRLEFQYAGLSFAAPQKVRYRYRLEGFDRDWIDAGTRRSAFYTNLPPGHYRFRVLAANNDGVWNSTGASFDLRLLPHYYQTDWFYAALVLGALLLGYLVYRWRVLQVEMQFGAVLAERGRLAREIHDTLAQGFVGISVQLELVARLLTNSRVVSPKPVAEQLGQQLDRQLDQARALVRDSLAEARRSIWDLRSESGGAEDLPARLTRSCNRVTNGSSAKVYLQVEGTYRPVARKLEEELLRIGEEAVANAVRHAVATRIDVRLIYESTRMLLRVADDGRGFELLPGGSGPEGHYGLKGMQERAKEIGADWSLESAPGAGTRILVEAPLA